MPTVVAASGAIQGWKEGSPARSSSGKRRNPTSIQGLRNVQPNQPPASGNANQGNGGAAFLSWGRSRTAVKAGLSVNELNAEITVETAIVMANWRKKAP